VEPAFPGRVHPEKGQYGSLVLPRPPLDAPPQRTAEISTIEKLAGQPVHWELLAGAVAEAEST
jgi:hypothetical protein